MREREPRADTDISLARTPTGVSAEHAAHYQRVDAATAKPAVSLEEKTALARKVLEEKPPRVFIGMVTTKEGLQGPLITAAINTWVQDVPPEWHVHLFVGDCKTLRKSPLPQLPKVQVSRGLARRVGCERANRPGGAKNYHCRWCACRPPMTSTLLNARS